MNFSRDNKNETGVRLLLITYSDFFVFKISLLPSTEQRTTKVLIDDIPSLKRDAAQLEAYMTSLMKLPCSVKQYGKSFVATFERAIGKCYVKVTMYYVAKSNF